MNPWALAAVLAAAARADTVHLANGNVLEGLIVSEDKAHIVLDFGHGTTVIQRSAVERVTRDRRETLSKELRARRFESGEGVPREAKTLDALLRRAEDLRETAVDARFRLEALERERRALVRERPAALDRELALAVEIKRRGGDPVSTPGLAAELNAARAERSAAGLRLEQIEEEERGERGALHAYLEAADAARDRAEGPDRALLARARGPYYDWLKPRLAALASAVSRDVVSLEPGDHKGIVVKALINGRVAGRFMVDTGASMTLVYSDFARALNLKPADHVSTARTTVADGRSMPAEIVRLRSLAVGRSRVEGLEAAVLPGSVPGIDGLLGMNFLSRFVVRVDGAAGRLILEDLK